MLDNSSRMSQPDLSDADIEQARTQLESALREVSQLPVRDVTHVGADEVDARGPAGPGSIKDETGPYEVFFRVTVDPPDGDDILETRGDISEYLRTQLATDIERNSNAPDTMIVQSDFPPAHIDKPLVFYVRSVL